jgi:hypothetical protein
MTASERDWKGEKLGQARLASETLILAQCLSPVEFSLVKSPFRDKKTEYFGTIAAPFPWQSCFSHRCDCHVGGV